MSILTIPTTPDLSFLPAASSCPVCESREIRSLLQAPDRFHGRWISYRLLSCSSCSLVWLADPPPPEQMAEHYGLDYDRSVASAGDSPERFSERIAKVAEYKTGGALLDLGCSSGGFLREMRSSAWTLHGIEMSQAVARQAEAASGAAVFVGDILDAPYPAGSFDLVTCFHVLEHVYQPLDVLRKIAYWLKPEGIFYVNVPNIDSAGARLFKSYWYALELPRHLYHYSPRSLGVMAKAVGLDQVSVFTQSELFLEESFGYLLDGICHRLGVSRTPRARRKRPSLAFRVVRKGFRMTAKPVFNGVARLIGDGESIHAVLRKPAP
jgi:2-polyprenyl-3-methyl-5-hydroxy-6-metoxy-1,4-benzoquinol methylase